MIDKERRYFGKYRGTVMSTVDPGLQGRITALITLGGTPMELVAEACTPYPGFYAVPPEGSGVWIEFAEGLINYPIWTGCWWREGELLTLLSPDLPPPDPASAPKTVVLAVSPSRLPGVPSTARLKLDSVTGTVTLESLMPPATPVLPSAVKISPLGMQISWGPNTMNVTLTGIDMNKSALTILPTP